METYSKDTLISDKQALLQFVSKLQQYLKQQQQYLNEREAEGYPPRLDYAADFTRPFVTDLKNRVANIQKYIEAEADFGFAIEICQHTNIMIFVKAKGCYIGYSDTRYLAEGIDVIIKTLCQIEKRICGAVLGSMIQANYCWHIYGNEIIRDKGTPYLEEKRPIPTTILQIKLNAAEGHTSRDRQLQRGKAGRPSGRKLTFADKIINCTDKKALLDELHTIIEAEPNDYGTPFKAAGICLGIGKKLGLFYGITYEDMCNEFGIPKGNSGNFSKYRRLDRQKVSPLLRENMKNLLKKHVSNSSTNS